MVITVLGHFCIDHFDFGSAPEPYPFPAEQFGGILHTVAALSALGSRNDVIQPVFGVTAANYDRVIEFLRAFPTVDVSGIFRHKGKTNHVYINKSETGETVFCSKDIAPSIPFNRVRPYLECDGILVNMISGFDITLETRDYIRMETRDAGTPIHFDFHSLTMGVDNEYKRFYRPLTDWRRWCFMMNSIQMTETEAAGLTYERFDEPTLINHLMPLMVEALTITRGPAGATLVEQKNKKLTRHELKGVPVEQPVHTIGCGDVFGAAFFLNLLKKNPPAEAAHAATLAAAAKTLVGSIDQYAQLPDLMKSLAVPAAEQTGQSQ